MNRAPKLMCLSLLAALPLSAGCVPQDRYDQLLTSYRSTQEQLVVVEGERDTARSNLDTLRKQLARATGGLDDLQGQNSRLAGDLDRVSRDYDELMRRVSELEIGPLPMEIESAIQSLAAAYPDVLTFDARRGLLRFASDFTFDLGSVALKPDASRTLQELARILNTDKAREFEVRIVGHTDDVRISRPQTLQHHPTNTHLSVHRAISVRDSLVQSGVNAVRMQVAGYGEHRPLVANRPGGTAENRRVEIFLVAMPTGVAPAPAAPIAPAAAVSVPVEPMK